jgi:MFS family permease
VPTFASERRWLVLFVLCIAVFLVVVDNTIVNVALPTISRDLHASNSSLQWIVDGYSLPFAGLLLAGGGLSDRWGRKRAMQMGLFAFAVSSLLAAFSHNVTALLTTRALMGASAALIFPATLSTLTVVFDDRRERATAFGLWGATTGIAIALGPIAGGELITHFFFGSIFLVNVPVALIGGDRAGIHHSQSSLDGSGRSRSRHDRRYRADLGDHPGTLVGVAFVANTGSLRCRGLVTQRIRELRTGSRRTADERADF